MVEVYDKKYSTDGLMTICWVTAIPCLICTAIIVLNYSYEEINQSFPIKTLSLLVVIPAGLFGILRVHQQIKAHGSIGETSYIKIKDDSIQFLNKQIRIDEIESITIRIRKKIIEGYFSGNNYLEIKTPSDKYELGLLINGEKGIDSVEQMIKNLNQKKALIIYEKHL